MERTHTARRARADLSMGYTSPDTETAGPFSICPPLPPSFLFAFVIPVIFCLRWLSDPIMYDVPSPVARRDTEV